MHIFQSTSLVRGTTSYLYRRMHMQWLFQSTSLVRGTTFLKMQESVLRQISIHVPRERDDQSTKRRTLIMKNFNPRPSWEGRLFAIKPKAGLNTFQSTSLVRGTTPQSRKCINCWLFQSTSLVRGTTFCELLPIMWQVISIHVPRERDDRVRRLKDENFTISIHVPRERDDGTIRLCCMLQIISIHVPRERDDILYF